MTCEQHQERILDYEQLTTADQQAVDAHIWVCPNCREVAREWRALDTALTQQLRAPALSASFDRQLHQRIASEPTAASRTSSAERRRALEAEYATSCQRRNWRRWVPRLLDVLGYGVAGGIGGWLLLALLTRESATWIASRALTGPQLLVVSSAAGIVITLGLVAAAFRRPMRRVRLR